MTSYVPWPGAYGHSSSNTSSVDNGVLASSNSSITGNQRNGLAPTAPSMTVPSDRLTQHVIHSSTPTTTSGATSSTSAPTSSTSADGSSVPVVIANAPATLAMSPSNASSVPLMSRPVSVSSPPQSSRRPSNNNDLITYIFPDFNAVNYIRKDFTTAEFYQIEETVVSGFDIYLVDQWVQDRRIGTVVATYTGNLASKITATKFTISRKPTAQYPARFQQYLSEIRVNQAKLKRMDEKVSRRNSDVPSEHPNIGSSSGTASVYTSASGYDDSLFVDRNNEVCYVTNLASLPSILNLIPIINGDSREIMRDFVINSNLKKLQCSGRSLYLTTERISDANEDKFRHMYKMLNPNVPIKFAIRELVNIIQTSLFYFDLLDAKYCDGFLCNKTEEAISNWWNLIGLPHFNIKPNPSQGKLPARSVAAIISFVLSIKLRLQIIGGCDVPKDPYDFENFMLSIGQFQKQYKLEKKRKLDLETLNKLFTITNAKLLPERNANYSQNISSATSPNPNSTSGFAYSNNYTHNHRYNDPYLESIEQFDADIPLSPTQSYSPRNAAQSHKKKSYTKELKKFTNVVKNTLQDPNRDTDDAIPSTTGGRIRSRIAKLSDNISPLDVETLDLELLVKHYLMGKVLIRLFRGVLSNNLRTANGVLADEIARKKSDPRNQNVSLVESQYQFVSLKDNITYNQGLGIPANGGGRYPISDFSKYSRGFNRMKLGLQNRRHLLSSTANRGSGTSGSANIHGQPFKQRAPSNIARRGSHNSYDETHGTDHELDAEFDNMAHTIPSRSSLSCKTSKSRISHLENPLEQFQRNLNRRNSFPNLIEKHDWNLNSLAFAKKDNLVKPIVLEQSCSKRRSLSFSQVEDFVLNKSGDGQILTMDKFTDKYLHTISNMLKYENLRHLYDLEKDSAGDSNNSSSTNKRSSKLIDGVASYAYSETGSLQTNANIRRNYKLLNLDLVKVKNALQQMTLSKAKVIDENFIGNLQFNINDLGGITDRLLYETRIVVKRIDELEDTYKMLDVKLNHECKSKMTNIITATINSAKFNEVFSNPVEREEMILKLVGDREDVRASISSATTDQVELKPPTSKVTSIFQSVIRFIYEMILFVSLLFKFNRAHMNLDRIRQSWVKLDPNRSIINRAYSYVGRDPPRDYLASAGGSEPLDEDDPLFKEPSTPSQKSSIVD